MPPSGFMVNLPASSGEDIQGRFLLLPLWSKAERTMFRRAGVCSVALVCGDEESVGLRSSAQGLLILVADGEAAEVSTCMIKPYHLDCVSTMPTLVP